MTIQNWRKEDKVVAIREVAVVDDKEENLTAAKVALAEILPNAKVRCFNSAGMAVAELMFLGYKPSLVLTDLDIQESDEGYKVNMAAWGNGIPAVIVTAKAAGGTHGTTTSISMLNGSFGHAEKDDPETWKKVINFILEDNVSAVHYCLIGMIPPREKFSSETAESFDTFSRLFLKY